MSGKQNIRLLIVFSVAFSLGILVGPSSGGFNLPTVQPARALLQPCRTHGSGGACSEFWYPAGPEMNTLTAPIFTDAAAEYSCLQAPSSCIDFPDSPIPSSQIQPEIVSSNFLVTAPVAETSYYEIEFLLANTFWNCNFSFGNAACGLQIRQGIAHMIDKTSFTNNEAFVAGISTPIDNPVPTSTGGGLLSPNPCGYDASFMQSGASCVVGAVGGTAYHLGSASGANGVPWLYAPGSADLNAAAQHFVNAGLATSFNRTTSILIGVTAAAASNPPTFFIRNDDPARLDLGNSLAQEICYMFTGSYTLPCTYLRTVMGGLPEFPGFVTCVGCTSLSWWMYTAAFSHVQFFDDSLYFGYNSRFVSGNPAIQPPNGPCSSTAIPTGSASNYMYVCSPAYDSLSSQMEFAPCLSAQGDPVAGATSNLPTLPGNGLCAGTSQISARSAGIQAEATFGAGAFTLPVYERTIRFGYLNGWSRVINSPGAGLPNYFTWLNAWNPSPVVPGTIRQGFSEEVKSVNPYIASTAHDLYIVNNVYDSLYALNPLDSGQQIAWLTISSFQECGVTPSCTSTTLGYTPPPNTTATYRFTLRPDLYFQDGTQVTAYDVAFSYLSLIGSGAFQSAGATDMTGLTVLQSHQFDISVSSLGPFVLPNLTGLSIQPGRYWTNAGTSAWDNAITCTNTGTCGKSQYTLSGATPVCDTIRNPTFNCTSFPASLMTINPSDATPSFDPIASRIFVGSGAWACGTVTTGGSGTCTSSGTMIVSPGGSWTLTRFGASVSTITQTNEYFRSSTNAALWIWSEQGESSSFIVFASLVSCYGQPVNLSGPCGHWQQGIGNPGTGSIVGAPQVTVGIRFYILNWVAPFDWLTTPPTGIAPFAPVLYEGSTTLNPASVVGCPSGYDC